MNRNLMTKISLTVVFLFLMNLFTGIGVMDQTASAESIRLEAENAAMGGEAKAFTNMAGASGNSLVGNIHNDGCYVAFNNLPAAYSVRICYASIYSGNISVYLNNVHVQDLAFTDTGGWNGAGHYGMLTLNMHIKNGDSLKIQFDTGDKALNIDYIDIECTMTDVWTNYAAAEAPELVGTTYLIEDAADLAWVAAEVNDNAHSFAGYTIKINADIDLSAHLWVPIGKAEHPFSGNLDGNNKTISKLKIGTQEVPNGTLLHGGLFGYMALASESFVRNVTLDNIAVYITLPKTQTVYAGGLAGHVIGGTITGCRVSGVINTNGKRSYIAGLVGYKKSGMVKDCASAVALTGDYAIIGGVVGYNEDGTVQNCYNTGSLTGGMTSGFATVGGVVAESYGTVQNCYNTGNLTGGYETEIGGVVAESYGMVQNCYNTGSITSSTSAYIGGVVAYNDDGTVQNCYNTGSLTGGGGVLIGGIIYLNNAGTVQNCYNTGSLTGGYDARLGGIISYNRDVVQNNYFLQDTVDGTPVNSGLYGNSYSGSNQGAEPKTAAYMRDRDLTAVLNSGEAVFYSDFPGLKAINNGYPILTWQVPDFIGLWTDFAAAEPPELVDTVYLIEDAADLAWVAEEVNGNANSFEGYTVKINADIDLSAHLWVPIGQGEHPFSGNLDGNNKTISNLKIGAPAVPNDTLQYGGLFGYMELTSESFVKDVILDNIAVYITMQLGYAGGVAGYVTDGAITGCRVSGVINADGRLSYIAGLVGYKKDGMVKDCASAVALTGGDYTTIGGIAAESYGTVQNCCNTGSLTGGMTGGFATVGGVVAKSYGTVQNCYNTGNLTGGDETVIGGVAALNDDGTVQHCYNTGSLTGGANAYMGGVAAKSYGTVQNCYNTGNLTAGIDSCIGGVICYTTDTVQNTCFLQDTVDGTPVNPGLYGNGDARSNDGAEPKTAAYMRSAEFVTALNGSETVFCSGFSGGEAMNNGYPVFKWQAPDYMGRWTDFAAAEAPELVDTTYLIRDAADLAWVAAEVNGNANSFEGYTIKINADIDLSAHLWDPIGQEEHPFSGNLDGGNKIISGLKIGMPDAPNAPPGASGLFGCMDLNAESFAKDVILHNIAFYITIPEDQHNPVYMGGLAGKATGGTITGCRASGIINADGKQSYISGLVGWKEGGMVKDCTSAIALSGDNAFMGGLVGFNTGTVQNCCNTGSMTGGMTGGFAVAGGVVVYNAGGTVQNCYNTGSLTGGNSAYIGGVVAANEEGTVQSCYNSGSLTGGLYAEIGGVVAESIGGAVQSCYNTGNLTGGKDAYMGGIVGISEDSTIRNCYNTGNLTGSYNSWRGGVIGFNWYTLQNNYFLQDTVDGKRINPGLYGNGNPWSNDGAEPKTASYMRSAEFVTVLNGGETAFCSDLPGTEAINNGYPVLQWQTTGTRGLWTSYAAEEAPELTGTTYLIEDAADLAWVAAEVNGNANSFEGYTVKINADIDLSAHFWVPVGQGEQPFSGNFDGGNKTISGLKIGTPYIPNDTLLHGGLFGYMDLTPESFVKDVLLDDIAVFITIPEDQIGYVGGLAGQVMDGTITNCRVSGVINFNCHQCPGGGLVGHKEGGLIKDCASAVTLTGSDEAVVGGIAGYNTGTVENCCNTGSLTGGDGAYMGGIAAFNEGGTVQSCYNTGSLTGGVSTNMGGVVMYNISGTVQDCYNTACLTGGTQSSIGGVVNNNYDSTVQSCYNTGSLAGGAQSSIGGVIVGNAEAAVQNNYFLQDTVDGKTVNHGLYGIADNLTDGTSAPSNSGAEPKTAAYMRSVAFKNILNGDDTIFYSDFSGQNALNNGYPILKWQAPDFTGYWTDFPAAEAPELVDTTYLIEDAADLAWVAVQVNGNANSFAGYTIKLNADIDLSAHLWVPIGRSVEGDAPEEQPFSGNFDGGNKTISGLKIGTPAIPSDPFGQSGLFGYMDLAPESFVKDVILDNIAVCITVPEDRQEYAGGLAGKVIGGTITNCRASGTININATMSFIAGLVGHKEGGLIKDCASAVALSGNGIIMGGVVAYNSATVQNCCNTGSMTSGQSLYAGGVVTMNEGGTVEGCYNTGSMTGGEISVMGGVMIYNINGTVQDCYNTGSLTGGKSANIGGVVTIIQDGRVQNCYNTGSLTGGGEDTSIGGVVMCVYSGMEGCITVQNCYNTGNLTGGTSANIGGVVEVISDGSVQGCYNTGSIAGGEGSKLGGVIRHRSGGIVQNTYFLQDTVDGIPINAGLNGMVTNEVFNPESGVYTIFPPNEGAEPKTAAYMRSAEFVAVLNGDETIFYSDLPGGEALNNGYPILKWQAPATLTYASGTVTITSPYALANTVMIIAGYYADGIQTKSLAFAYTIKDISVAPGGLKAVPLDPSINDILEDGGKIKIFLWADLLTIRPIAKSLEITAGR